MKVAHSAAANGDRGDPPPLMRPAQSRYSSSIDVTPANIGTATRCSDEIGSIRRRDSNSASLNTAKSSTNDSIARSSTAGERPPGIRSPSVVITTIACIAVRLRLQISHTSAVVGVRMRSARMREEDFVERRRTLLDNAGAQRLERDRRRDSGRIADGGPLPIAAFEKDDTGDRRGLRLRRRK